MNRRSFFRNILVAAAAPSVFIPKLPDRYRFIGCLYVPEEKTLIGVSIWGREKRTYRKVKGRWSLIRIEHAPLSGEFGPMRGVGQYGSIDNILKMKPVSLRRAELACDQIVLSEWDAFDKV